MRMASSAFATLLAVCAAPSVAAAQYIALDPLGPTRSLDRAVPVAVVSSIHDFPALGGARVVDDSLGEPFVLGTATMDVSVPYRARVVFTITNSSDVPLSLKGVMVYERTMLAAQYQRGIDVGAPYTPLSASGWGPGSNPLGEALQPGTTLTVEVPISPHVCDRATCRADGFVLYVGRRLPQMDMPAGVSGQAWRGENPLFTRAFLQLLSTAQQ